MKLRFAKKVVATPVTAVEDDGTTLTYLTSDDPDQKRAREMWDAKEKREKQEADIIFRLKNRWCRCAHNEYWHRDSRNRLVAQSSTQCRHENTYGSRDCAEKCPAFLLERTSNGVS